METERRKAEFKERTQRASQSYQELARMFSSFVTEVNVPQRQETEGFSEQVQRMLCLDCPKAMVCCGEALRGEYAAAFEALRETGEHQGKVEYEDLDEFFKEECLFGRQINQEWNRAVLTERTKQRSFQQMMEGKEALVHQLEETAKCFGEMSLLFEDEDVLSESRKQELVRCLLPYHVRVKDVSFRRCPGKGREWCMKLWCEGKRSVSVRLIERLLSEKLGTTVRECSQWSRVISGEELSMVFRETPGYYAMTGVARSVKKEQMISGDSFSFFYEEEGEVAMILSDGMGSGEEAAKESEAVLELLEKMLSAGFKEETAIRLMNSVLALRAEQKTFATLDITRVNLYSGTCEFIKIGGAATYMKRGKWIECVEAETLPIGMVQRVDYDSMVKKLYDGDYIIMMSDGVLETVPEAERERFLSLVAGDDSRQNPQVIAGRILNAALAFQNYEPKDDMTVLVCGVFAQEQMQ